MNYFSFIPLAFSIILTFLGFNIYKNNPKYENLIFFLCMAALSALDFIFYNILHTNSIEIINFWIQLLPFWMIILPLFFHFIYIFLEFRIDFKFNVLIAAIYFISIIFMFLEYFNSTIEFDVLRSSIIFNYNLNIGKISFCIARIYSFIFCLVLLAMCLKYFKTGADLLKKSLLNYFILAIFLMLFGNLAYIFSGHYDSDIFFIHVIVLNIPLLIIAARQNKYSLDSRFLDLLFKNFILIEDDILIILNNKKEILFVNSYFYSKLGYTEKEIIGISLSKILKFDVEFHLEEDDVDKFNISIALKDGSYKKFIVDVANFRENNNKIKYTLLVGQNRKKDKGNPYLNICAYCKNVKLSGVRWVKFEEYLSDNFNLQFTHGICPDCYKVIVHKYSVETEENKKNLK